LDIPVENLISPEVIRQLVWKNPPTSQLESYIQDLLKTNGARKWQIDQIKEILVQPLLETEPLVVPEPPTVEESEAAE
jgi:ribonuclease D